LAPEARVRALEGVLVAVRVGDEHEPELAGLEHVLDGLVIRSPAGDQMLEEASVHLGRDPLARMLQRAVERGWSGPVGDFVRALRHLQRDDLPTLAGMADDLELEELRVPLGEVVHVRPETVRAVVVAPDVVAARHLSRGRLTRGLTLR